MALDILLSYEATKNPELPLRATKPTRRFVTVPIFCCLMFCAIGRCDEVLSANNDGKQCRMRCNVRAIKQVGGVLKQEFGGPKEQA